MKLGSLKSSGCRDGELVVVSRQGQWFRRVPEIATTLQAALENWNEVSPKLESVYRELNQGNAHQREDVRAEIFHSPLPRAYQWLDGSAYIQHIVLVRKARGAELPATLKTVPLMYQGGSDSFLAPTEDIPFIKDSYGLDFESEVAVILSDVEMGVDARKAAESIKLLVLVNDVTLRGLVPDELAQGFGFLQSKPSSAFSPFAVTPDELGDQWKNHRVHGPLITEYNQKVFGTPDAGQMHFSFGELIAHAARTRKLSAGTILGSGTVSNEDESRGSSCLQEKRMLEKIQTGEMKTPFMQNGDRVRIFMTNAEGESIFGEIHQKVVSVK